MHDAEQTKAKIAAPRTPASEIAAPRVHEAADRCRTTAAKLTDPDVGRAAVELVQQLEDAVDDVILAARADGAASDIATGRLEEESSHTALAVLHEVIAAFARARLIVSDDIAAHELLPQLLIMHTELQRLATHVRFEQAGLHYTEELRRQTSYRVLLLSELLQHLYADH